MWTKDETAKLKQSFWTAFGQYMRPVLGANGEPQRWLNYTTGISGLYFRAFAGGNSAVVGIEIADAGSENGKRLITQLNAVLSILKASAGEDWHWLEAEDRAPESVFYGTELKDVSIFKQEDWPALISFLKPRLQALDAFWQEAGWSFEFEVLSFELLCIVLLNLQNLISRTQNSKLKTQNYSLNLG